MRLANSYLTLAVRSGNYATSREGKGGPGRGILEKRRRKDRFEVFGAAVFRHCAIAAAC